MSGPVSASSEFGGPESGCALSAAIAGSHAASASRILAASTAVKSYHLPYRKRIVAPRPAGAQWSGQRPALPSRNHPGKHVRLEHNQQADQGGEGEAMEEDVAQDFAFLPFLAGGDRKSVV